MLTRRALLSGLGAVAAARFVACTRTPPAKPSWPRTSVHDGVEMIELFPNDADDTSPLIIAVHGMGDRPDRWVADWKRFPAKAHIALPRAFDAHGDGYSWFKLEDGMTDEQLGAAIGASEARLWKGVVALAAKRHVIVTGFSQGGMLSFAMASRHPDLVSHAFPVSGACPGPLLPKNRAVAAPLIAFHGTSDPILQITRGREAVHAFKEQGNDAQLREYEGVGHTITAEMHRDLWEAITKVLPSG